MESHKTPDEQQLGLWQPQTEEDLWGAAWYWRWLSQQLDNPKG